MSEAAWEKCRSAVWTAGWAAGWEATLGAVWEEGWAAAWAAAWEGDVGGVTLVGHTCWSHLILVTLVSSHLILVTLVGHTWYLARDNTLLVNPTCHVGHT